MGRKTALALILNLLRQFPRRAQEGGNSAVGHSLGCVAAVLEGAPVPLRSDRRGTPMHPATTVRHRRRLTLAPAPRPRTAAGALVHVQVACMGLFLVLRCNSPPGRPQTGV